MYIVGDKFRFEDNGEIKLTLRNHGPFDSSIDIHVGGWKIKNDKSIKVREVYFSKSTIHKIDYTF